MENAVDERPVTEDFQDAITRFWDELAADYDKAWAHGLHTRQEKEAWSALLNRLLPAAPPLRILDAGCGTGFLALLLANVGHEVVGVDLSQAMLTEARRQAHLRDVNATFLRGDAARPDPSLGTFDAVVSRHLLWTLPSPQHALQTWMQLLAPGGHILAIDGFWVTTRLRDRLAINLGTLLHRARHGHVTQQSYRPEIAARLPLYSLTELEPIRALLTHAGLTDVAVEPISSIDQAERALMPLGQRLRLRHRRYLAYGRLPTR